jgi:TRAP-type C4-dicarboxylate transport system permease large subunit
MRTILTFYGSLVVALFFATFISNFSLTLPNFLLGD